MSIIASVFLYISIGLYFSRNELKEIQNGGFKIIAKFKGFKKYPKSIDYSFEFYFQNIKKTIITTKAPEGFFRNTSKFYRLKYLDKYPDLIIVEFKDEVTDTTEILNAGFSKEDL